MNERGGATSLLLILAGFFDTFIGLLVLIDWADASGLVVLQAVAIAMLVAIGSFFCILTAAILTA